MMLLLLGISRGVHAQLSGSIGAGIQTTNNVQTLDTIAPDQILMPAFELNYDSRLSGTSTVSLSGSYTPSFYHINPGLSFHETSISATGIFYLTNQDDIGAETEGSSIDQSVRPSRSSRLLFIPEIDRGSVANEYVNHSTLARSEFEAGNDSLIDRAASALYSLSSELDSAEILHQGISKAKASELDDLRDSISDVVSTIADLLDSVGYSESTSEVVIKELEDVRQPLRSIVTHIRPSIVNSSLLDAAIDCLREANPEPDFLSTSPTPSAPTNVLTSEQKVLRSLATLPLTEKMGSISAPVLTLITSSTRLRQFGYGDAAVREDLDDSGATTMATLLTVPVDYTDHSAVHFSPADSVLFGGNFGGNPNDNSVLSFGTAIEGLTSRDFSLRGSYEFTHTLFPFDSVYSNNENRFTLTPRISISASTVLIGEAAIGFKKYIDPLIVSISETVHRPKKGDTNVIVSQTAGSSFDQFSFGLGLTHFIGQHWLLGGLIAFNNNPNLRAYVTTAQIATGPRGKALRAAAQIADDEYTYDLGRYSVFSDGRIWGGVDLGMDLSYEHRKYGSAVGKKGAVLDSGRTENGEFFNLSVSKLFPFNERWIGIFNGVLLEAKLESVNLVASQSIYNYKLSELTLTSTLTF